MSASKIPANIKKQMQRYLIKMSDVDSSWETDITDLIVSVIDKQTTTEGLNIEPAAKMIKDSLDKQYGPQWHCIIGKGFSYDVTAQCGSLLFVFYQGDLAILVWKC